MNQQTKPFIRDTERTAFCAANELTAQGSNSLSPLEGMNDADTLRALVEAARQMATAPPGSEASSSSLPQRDQTNGSTKKKEAASEEETMGGKQADPTHARRSIPQPIKVRMVELYAQFLSVSEVRDQIIEEFQILIDLRTVGMYNPAVKSATIGRKLRAHYDACRKLYVERSTDMAVAHQSHRLKLIGRIVEKATNSKDYAAALKGLELAAKEMGAYERPTVVQHTGAIAHVHGTVEEARAEVAMRLQAMVDGGVLLPAPSDIPLKSANPAPIPPAP